MASIYSCKECGTNFNLHTTYLYPPDFYFEAGNKGTLSFSAVDSSKFKFEKEDKIRPFFETLDYWGIQRKRTKMMCMNCGKLVGYVYDDGPPMTDSPGQFHFGPSQVYEVLRSWFSLSQGEIFYIFILILNIKFKPLYLHEVGVRSLYIILSPNPAYGITLSNSTSNEMVFIVG